MTVSCPSCGATPHGPVGVHANATGVWCLRCGWQQDQTADDELFTEAQGIQPDDEVTRIKWRYLDGGDR